MNRPAETRPGEPDLEVFELVFLAAVAVGLLAACLPALIVAVPLGMAIESGGWRRWPALAVGGALTGLVVLAGGWEGYRHTVVSFWAHLRFHHPFGPAELLAVLPLGVAGGILAAPLLPTLLHHRNEHEATRHYRQLSQERRTRTQARRTVGRAAWPTPEGRTVLGLPLGGTIANWRITTRGRSVIAAPLDVWRRQALIVGETGSGKTVTALTLAGEALRGGWDVYWIDGKADQSTARGFLALARAAGIEPRDATRQPLDGWRGDNEAIINRLLATQIFTESYYEGIARTVLQRAARDDTEALDARSERCPTKTWPAPGPATTASPGPSVPPSTAPGPTKIAGPLTSPSAGPRTATRPPRSAPSSSKTSSTGPSPANTPTGKP